MNNIGNKISDILSGISGGKFQSSVGKISELLSSKEGEKLKNSLTESQKKAIIDKFMSLDADEVKEKLSNFDPKKIEGLSGDDIMRFLK